MQFESSLVVCGSVVVKSNKISQVWIGHIFRHQINLSLTDFESTL